MDNPSINLSDEISLVYVLSESGCHGGLTVGRVERTGLEHLNVYDKHGKLFEYLSGALCKCGPSLKQDSMPLEDWSGVLPEDVHLIVSYAMERSYAARFLVRLHDVEHLSLHHVACGVPSSSR
jgi:hypothetical protein